MPTTNEFLMSIGIDKDSVDAFVQKAEAAKAQVAADPITIQLAVAMDASVSQSIAELQQFRDKEDAAAMAAERLAAEEKQVADALDELQASMQATAQATADTMVKADAAIGQLQMGVVALGVAAAGMGTLLARASEEARGDEQANAALAISYGTLTEKAIQASEEINAATGRAVGYVQQLLASTNLSVQAFGYSGEAALDVSRKMVQAAIDMSAVTGTDAQTILSQFTTGLRMSGRALLQYGISLDDARVKAEALKMGLDPKKLDTYAEAQVKLALILRDTAKFTGAASGEQQTMTERLKDLSDAVGGTFGELGRSVNEILAPFVSQVIDIVNEVKKWIADNPRLAKTLAYVSVSAIALASGLGLLLGAVYAVTFAYKTYVALESVIVGAQVAIALATGTATTSTLANTVALDTNTSAQAANARAVQANAVAQSVVGKAATILNSILRMTNAQVWANVKAWASLTLLKVKDWVFNGYQAITSMASGVVTLTAHLLKGQIGLRAWVNMVGSELNPALLQTVGSTSALTTATLAAATAYAGFKLGGFLEEMLGLADAQERVEKGTATTSDKIKSGLVDALMVLIGPIGWAGLAWKKYYEYQAQAGRAADAAAIKKAVDALNPQQVLKYNEYIKQGMVDWRALKAAIGDTTGQLTRFTFLLGQRQQGKTSRDDLLELESIYLELSKTIPGFADMYAKAMGRVSQANTDLVLSVDQAANMLKDTQKRFDEVKKNLESTQIKLNFGEDTAKAYADLQSLNQVMELFRQRAAAHQAVVADLNKTKITSAISGDAIRTQIDAQERSLAEIRRLSEIASREQQRILEESFTKQAGTLKQGYDAEVKAAEDRKNRVVDIERKKVDELQTQIERELGIRKSANERAEAFNKSLDDAALRRRDATQAEIKSLIEQADAALKDSNNQANRADTLAKVAARVKELAADETEAKRIAEDLAAARKQLARDEMSLADATKALNAAMMAQTVTENPQERIDAAEKVKQATLQEADARERVQQTQAKIAETQAAQTKEAQLQAERATLSEKELADLKVKSDEQAKAALDRDQSIADMQNQKLTRQKEINDAEAQFQREVIKSKAEYEKKIEALDRMHDKMMKVVELQRELTRLVAAQNPDKAEVSKVAGALAAEQAIMTEDTKTQQKLDKPIESFDAQVAAAVASFQQTLLDATNNVTTTAEAVKTTEADLAANTAIVQQGVAGIDATTQKLDITMGTLAAAVANLIPANEALLQKTTDIENAVAPIPDAMDSALDAQSSLAVSVESLGNTTLAFAKSMQKKWEQVGIRLDALDAAIRNMSSEGDNAAASGY